MTDRTEEKIASLGIRVEQLEIRVSDLSKEVDSQRKGQKRKLTKTEKETVKQELLKGGPYDKKKLDDLKLNEIKMLASAMEINSFGKQRDEIAKLILGKEKVGVKKKASTK